MKEFEVMVSDLPKLSSKVPLRPCRGIHASMHPADLSYLLARSGSVVPFFCIIVPSPPRSPLRLNRISLHQRHIPFIVYRLSDGASG
jgi:hypothetical protein